MKISDEILEDLRLLSWQEILDYATGLKEFDNAQWRFLKGYIVEVLIEKKSISTLGPDLGFTYVGDKAKDYVWGKHSISVELKSLLSSSMYTKKGKIRKNFKIKLNNSNGSNTKQITLADIADIILVVLNDGIFIIDNETALENVKHTGDGNIITIPGDLVIEISGRIITGDKYTKNSLKEKIEKIIHESISNV